MGRPTKLLVTPCVFALGIFLCACESVERCVPHDSTLCEEGYTYWVDSCGEFEELLEQCQCGCNDEVTECKSCECVPNCEGRCCGDDGCLGSCPNRCANTGQVCNDSTCECVGSCLERTCAEQGFECGIWTDGCGERLDCGGCPAGQACDAQGHCQESCPAGTTLCQGLCVDTSSDPRHCGGCGQDCDQGQLCEDSDCVDGPDCRQTPCTGFTYCDLNTGNCLPGCLNDEQCLQNEHCQPTHDCVCDTDFHRCSGACVSDASPLNCGARCEPCPSDLNGTSTCTNGGCGITCNANYLNCGGICVACADPHGSASCSPNGGCLIVCHSGYHLCHGACVTDDDPAHCGDRCDPCPPDGNGTAVCTNGQCGLDCHPGFHLCSDQCVSNSSPATCGSLCTPCPGDPNGEAVCANGQCGLDCHPGYHECDGHCESDSSTSTCGNLCTPCPDDPNGWPTCQNGQCGLGCNGGYHFCYDTCASDTDPASCGELCNPCPDDPNGEATCVDGACGLLCNDGYHLCANYCADDQDPLTCGDLCDPCPGTANGTSACVDGACRFACDLGYYHCPEGCCPWQISTVLDSPGDRYRARIAVHHDGTVWISYLEGLADYRRQVWLTTMEGGNWVHQLIDEVDSYIGLGSANALVVDSQGFPHLAYVQFTNYNNWQVRHATDSQGSMDVTIAYDVVNQTSDIADRVDLAIDGQDQPAILFREKARMIDTYSIQLLRPVSDVWQVNAIYNRYAHTYWLGVDEGGQVMAMLDRGGTGSDSWMTHWLWDGSDWYTVQAEQIGSPCLDGLRALDPLGRSHAFYRHCDEGRLRHSISDGFDVIINDLGPVQSINYFIPPTVFRLDSDLHPFALSNTPELTFGRWDGTDWHEDLVAATSHASSVDFVLDNQDRPHLVYIEDGVVKYATW